jgi:hypothetical protein
MFLRGAADVPRARKRHSREEIIVVATELTRVAAGATRSNETECMVHA